MGKQILIFLDKTLIFGNKIFFWVPPKDLPRNVIFFSKLRIGTVEI